MDENFESFFRERVKERGFSVKKLSEVTGIAPAHLENMLRGSFEDLPSAPYFHGYIIRLAKALDFDADEWWEKIRKEGLVKNSGSADTLPRNRFVRQSPAKFILLAIIALVLLAYFIFEIPHILGRPTLTLSSPDQNPYTATSSTITMEGTVQNADSLYLKELNESNGEEITIAPNGSWQKGVLLQDGINTFDISAKKLLGGETNIVEQVIYSPAPSASSGTTSVSSGTSIAPTGSPATAP